MPQFGRSLQVQVDTVKFQDLDAQFNVVRNLSKDPNTCDLRVFNLNRDHRNQLATLRDVFVSIQAGYEGEVSEIFKGRLREAYSERDGADWVTVINSGDGSKALRRARINKSFGPGTKTGQVIRDLVKELGINQGNLEIAIPRLVDPSFVGAGNEYVNGTTVSGRVSEELTAVLKSVGKEWSIQSETLQILTIARPLEGFVFRLTPTTGLIGSPTIGSDGVVNARALLNGQILPGRQVQISSAHIPDSFVRVERAEFTGDTSATDWYVDLEGKAL